ncbi:MAG TPA: c-type cytochrome domain-containing protein [Planctomycetota bacterium]|nr:c-type cytochrome domain-containing protein [Planctomycetota bacterium]
MARTRTLALACTLMASATLMGAEVSFTKDIVPIMKRNCQGCHRPAKMKGDLDLTSYKTFAKGGKNGVSFKSGDMKSMVLEQVRGDEPKMPPDGDKLKPEEIALLERWIKEGAKDDTPAVAARTELAVYKVPPVISAATYSPDGKVIAVSGYHEVAIHKSDGSELLARLVCDSPRIEGLAYSPDGTMLAACGGAPGVYGEILIWDTATAKLKASYKISPDSLYGISFSPDNTKVAVGGADKTVRLISVADGKELLKFDNHADWVFSTTFTKDGKRLLSGSRDKAMKLIDAGNGQLIDDVNKLLEPILCFARNPKEDVVAYGGALGVTRIYKMSDNQQRTAANNDVNMLKAFERQPGPIRAIAYSPDGTLVAIGGMFDGVRIFKTADATKAASIPSVGGATFSLAFHPDGTQLLAGGFDGTLRIFEAPSGKLIKSFAPVPLADDKKAADAGTPASAKPN